MKQLFLNLKRFDIPPEMGGVNRLAPGANWGSHIVEAIQAELGRYAPERAEFGLFLPEAHLLPAIAAKTPGSPVRIGCQGVHWQDTAPGGNFGAFTTGRTANAMVALGCTEVVIGHCEERRDMLEILQKGGIAGAAAKRTVNRLLNASVKAAQRAGLRVLYCIGETAEERSGEWQRVLAAQLAEGLSDADTGKISIAYEPIWSIGPGKTPASREEICEVATFVKEKTSGQKVVYGGGLKQENAEMLASISEIDGGLIALTRFTGEIGFYPEEYLEIVRLYLGNVHHA